MKKRQKFTLNEDLKLKYDVNYKSSYMVFWVLQTEKFFKRLKNNTIYKQIINRCKNYKKIK